MSKSASERFNIPAVFEEWAGKDNYDALQRAADTIANPDSTPKQIVSTSCFVLASARFVLNTMDLPFSLDLDYDEE